MGKSRITSAQKSRIAEMVDRDVPIGTIAKRLGYLPSTIAYHVLRAGGRPIKARSPGSYMRRGMEVKGFSAEEDAFIQRLAMDGIGITAIGRKCGAEFGKLRRPNSISARLSQLAATDEFTAQGRGL